MCGRRTRTNMTVMGIMAPIAPPPPTETPPCSVARLRAPHSGNLSPGILELKNAAFRFYPRAA